MATRQGPAAGQVTVPIGTGSNAADGRTGDLHDRLRLGGHHLGTFRLCALSQIHTSTVQSRTYVRRVKQAKQYGCWYPAAVIRWRNAVVVGARREWPGAVELEVTTAGGPLRALAYPALTGRPQPGDRVLLNATAVELGLGTGGYALVIAVPDRLPEDPPGPGHVIKARYTPMQACVAGADEQGSPHHEVLRDADDLGGMPVIVADLHSALPAILAGLREAGPRVAAYVMLDGGTLPAWFSRSAAGLRTAGWLAGTVSTGQSFGGDLETVTVHTGLLAARHVLGAEVAVVTQGPGNLGTGTRWGFSGVACGEAVNAAAVLGGRPVASLRVSEADARPRHRGVSHHSLTAYGRVALARADVAVPVLPGEFGTRVRADVAPLAT